VPIGTVSFVGSSRRSLGGSGAIGELTGRTPREMPVGFSPLMIVSPVFRWSVLWVISWLFAGIRATL